MAIGNDDLIIPLPDKTFKEVIAARDLRVFLCNEAKTKKVCVFNASAQTNKAMSNPHHWPQTRSWRGERFV
jgi:hypothetical protein